MAKTTKNTKKKSSKVTTTATSQKTEPVAKKPVPSVEQGFVSLAVSLSDLNTLANLLTICAKVFEQQALIAAEQGDENKYSILTARHKVSSHFADRFIEFCKMPEPVSREMH